MEVLTSTQYESRLHRSKHMKKLWNTDAYRSKMISAINETYETKPEVKMKIGETTKSRWSDPVYFRKTQAAIKAGWTPELREWKSAQMKAKHRGEPYLSFDEWKKTNAKKRKRKSFEDKRFIVVPDEKPKKSLIKERKNTEHESFVPQTKEERRAAAWNAGLTRLLRERERLAEERRKRLHS